MTSFHEKRSVPFSADEMFALVADVERYPDFVPLCDLVEIRERWRVEQAPEILIVDMQVGLHLVRRTVTSRVSCDSDRKEVSIRASGEPFKELAGRWAFRDELSGDEQAPRSTVEFSMRYEFESFTLGLVVGTLVDAAFERYAEAFVRRARAVYRRQ